MSRLTKRSLIPFLLAILTGSSQAFPSLSGPAGFLRTVSADVPTAGSYSFFFTTIYQQALVEDSLVFIREPAGIDTVLLVQDREHYLDGETGIDLSITDNVELALSVSYKVNAYQFDQVTVRKDYVGIMDVVHGFDRIRASLKYGRGFTEWFTAGGLLWMGFPLGNTDPDTVYDADGYWEAGQPRLAVRRPFSSTGKRSWGFLALASASYGMLQGNINLGYSSYRQEYEDSVLGTIRQDDGALDFAVGMGIQAPQAVIFLEYSVKSFLSRRGDDGYSAPARLTGGLRLFDDTGAYLDIAGELGLSDYAREEFDPYETGRLPVPGGIPGDWGVLLGIGFDTQLVSGDTGDSTGFAAVVGTLVDGNTHQPLTGTVSFPGNPISPTFSDSVTGFFRAPVTSGTLVVRAEGEGYLPSSATVVVAPGETVPVDFMLYPGQTAPQGGGVMGTVSDAARGEPIAATVSVEGEGTSVSAGASGAYSLELACGAWSLGFTAPGYLDRVRTVSVSGGQTTALDIVMDRALESGETLSFANIYFDSGSAVLQTSSYEILNEITQLLRNNSGVNVEIVGHTDSDGSSSYNRDLSERRAASVRTYLVQQGISSSRLSTLGMGESSPVASNDTPQGKAQNRRIEFRIL